LLKGPFEEEIPEVTVILKNTFIELVHSPTGQRRPRALTDSVLLEDSSDISTGAPSDTDEQLTPSSLAQRKCEGKQVVASQSTFEVARRAPNEPVKEMTETKTTVMLRNLPSGYSRSSLLELLAQYGFWGTYDFAYMPVDFGSGCCLGYAFVNFNLPCEATRCWQTFNGFAAWGRPCDKVCELTWGRPHQGLWAHIERYRNSPVMHESVPDEWKPAVFAHGARVAFPAPTKKLKAPQLKCRNKAKARQAF